MQVFHDKKISLILLLINPMVVNQNPNFTPYVDLNDALKDGYKPLFTSQPDMPQP